MKTMKGKKH